MQQGLIESSNSEPHANTASFSSTSQHGILRSQSGLEGRDGLHLPSRGPSEDTVLPGRSDPAAFVDDLNTLDRDLGRLSIFPDSDSEPRTPSTSARAQRIADYENAGISSTRGRRQVPVGFQVTKCPGSLAGAQLTDCPNEILTQILSHLHPDSHSAVALVSKRFYALVMTPYAWRTAFLRYFPGQDALVDSAEAAHRARDVDSANAIRSESRYFARLTSMATWRSEYLLRSRLLRSVTRGKPGSSTRLGQSGKKSSAVLTYNSKLPWLITHIHGSFTGGRKGPRIVHGTAALGIGSTSDPTNGRLEKWGLDDPFTFVQLDEVFPNLQPYGVGDGPAAVPNVMDVSQPYGVVGGEGFPGGRVHVRATGEIRGRYLTHHSTNVNTEPEIPKIPELIDAVSAVWVSKSSAFTSMTQSMVGILAGSTLGIVTSYAIGNDTAGPRFNSGDMTARWVLSPGVPIIDIKVDDNYNQKRKALGRVWAVALNALGEVFYLTQTPTPPTTRSTGEEAIKAAWHAGRTAYWEIIESTRRTARADEYDRYAVLGTYSPRSSAHFANLSKGQTLAEAQEIEKFFLLKPAHFRTVCEGWDMRRKLEVDFAGGDEPGVAGEGVFVITCGYGKEEQAAVSKYARSNIPSNSGSPAIATPPPADLLQASGSSIFGGTKPQPVGPDGGSLPISQPVTPVTPPVGSLEPEPEVEVWKRTEYLFESNDATEITATAVDMSTFAVMASFEDPLVIGSHDAGASSTAAIKPKTHTTEIPGRRSRLLAIGTNTGSVIMWNMRDKTGSTVNPSRLIQTDSPEISSLALSALYLVHGGSDGLVQAWDPLASTLEALRTLNARSSGRIPRHILNANPALRHVNCFAVGAILLDPDPAVLRGVLSFGTFVRSWTYSSTGQSVGRKRRLRHSDVHGRLASRRQGGTVSAYIACEEAELRRQQEFQSREMERLRSRFGVGLGDLTDEEAVRYAELISEQSLIEDELRRLEGLRHANESSTDSNADTGSSTGSVDTVTPELSPTEDSPAGANLAPLEEAEDDDDYYEAQIQQALRLSLMEAVNDSGQSPREHSPYEVEIKVKTKKDKKKGKGSPSASPVLATPSAQSGGSSWGSRAFENARDDVGLGVNSDEDMALALQLSLEEEEARQRGQMNCVKSSPGFGIQEEDEFPALEVTGKGKGKWV